MWKEGRKKGGRGGGLRMERGGRERDVVLDSSTQREGTLQKRREKKPDKFICDSLTLH